MIANVLPKERDAKRRNSGIYDNNDSVAKKPKMNSLTPMSNIKKNNAMTSKKCKICYITVRESLVNHYVNEHPDNEVYPSRVAPNVGDYLRKSKEIHKCERKYLKDRWMYEQCCYFCNKIMTFRKGSWIDHIIRHTGYYQYRCPTSSMKFVRSFHNCDNSECKTEKIPQPQFEEKELLAYLCECNYVRFKKTEMEEHIKCEHQNRKGFKEVTFLRFPEYNDEVVQPKQFNEKEIEEMSMGESIYYLLNLLV